MLDFFKHKIYGNTVVQKFRISFIWILTHQELFQTHLEAVEMFHRDIAGPICIEMCC